MSGPAPFLYRISAAMQGHSAPGRSESPAAHGADPAGPPAGIVPGSAGITRPGPPEGPGNYRCHFNHRFLRLRQDLVVPARPARSTRPAGRPARRPPPRRDPGPPGPVAPPGRTRFPAAFVPSPLDRPRLLVGPVG